MDFDFDYRLAFSRNIGWITEKEQTVLRQKTVAIAGMGGVGGSHLLTLTRLGIEKFHIADFDHFELPNFNRQAGAGMSTIGRSKAETLAQLARDINPNLETRIFGEGISDGNMSEFLEGVDLYIDGLDFFAFDVRERVFQQSTLLGIPAVTAAPLGMSAAVLNFLPGGMTFEEYFQLAGRTDLEKALRFLVGLAPALLQRSYLMDPRQVSLSEQKGPSTVIACQLCASLASTEGLKILLRRGRVLAAPHGLQFDAYLGRVAHTWRPGGNRHPLNRLALAIAKRRLAL